MPRRSAQEIAEEKRIVSQKLLMEKLEKQREADNKNIYTSWKADEQLRAEALAQIEAQKAKIEREQYEQYKYRYVEPKPWLDSDWGIARSGVKIEFPFALKLTSQLSKYLDQQLMSSARADVVRAEIIDAPDSSGNVSVCVIFRRNGSSFVDQFVIRLIDLYTPGGLDMESYRTLEEMPKSAPISQPPAPAFNPAAIENAYRAALNGTVLPRSVYDQVNSAMDKAVNEMMSVASEVMLEGAKTIKPEKPITSLDVIEKPGLRMIEL